MKTVWSFCCLLLAAGLSACSSDQKPAPAQPAASTSQRIPIGQLPAIDTTALLQHTKVLS
jgi:hypothetical protein